MPPGPIPDASEATCVRPGTLTQIKADPLQQGNPAGMNIPALIAKYDRRVPRYTSYPTAPHFSPAVTAADYAGWLGALEDDAALSLYLHVPFCASLCLFCACHTSVVHRPEPLESYGKTLLTEIQLVAAAIGRRLKVRHIHWGGGTPTALPPALMRDVMRSLRMQFRRDAGRRGRGRSRSARTVRRLAARAGGNGHDARQPRRAGFRPAGAADGAPRAGLRPDRRLRRTAARRRGRLDQPGPDLRTAAPDANAASPPRWSRRCASRPTGSRCSATRMCRG